MDELNRGRRTAGQSRAKVSRSRSTSARTGSSYRSSSTRSTSRNTARRRSSGSSYNKRRRRPGGRRSSGGGWWVVIAGLALIVAVSAFILGGKDKKSKETEAETDIIEIETTVPPTELEKEVMVDGLNITGMSRDAAKGVLLKEYQWSMTLVNGEEVYEVANLMEKRIDALLDEIYFGEPKESYSLDTDGLDEEIIALAADVAQKWDKKAKNGSISSFDASANKFVFSEAEAGQAVDQEQLIAAIQDAILKKDFDAAIQVPVNAVQPEFSEEAAREKYKTIATFSTNTTANRDRNTNVRLACEAINGHILYPGEEFSFNDVVGQRTEEKGYKAAAAYNNGEVVQEIGGGVCQVSTTLYNAVLQSGLKTTVRRSHTYEPSYVTPGRDATVSYGGPDYKFVNNSSTAIGIRASYGDQVCTVSIYGIPILEEGVKYTLKSTKIKDMDPPAPTYEEDQTLQPGVEKVKSQGSQGSYWETRLIVTKDGVEISNDVDHNTTYKGHAPVVLRNTSGVVMLPEQTTTVPPETVIASEGAADGLTPSSAAETKTSESSTAESKTTESSTTESKTSPETSRSQEPQSVSPTSAAETSPVSVEAGPGFVSPGDSETISSQSPGTEAPVTPDGPGGEVIAPNPLTGIEGP